MCSGGARAALKPLILRPCLRFVRVIAILPIIQLCHVLRRVRRIPATNVIQLASRLGIKSAALRAVSDHSFCPKVGKKFMVSLFIISSFLSTFNYYEHTA